MELLHLRLWVYHVDVGSRGFERVETYSGIEQSPDVHLAGPVHSWRVRSTVTEWVGWVIGKSHPRRTSACQNWAEVGLESAQE